jgi:hypothetical protein
MNRFDDGVVNHSRTLFAKKELCVFDAVRQDMSRWNRIAGDKDKNPP